MNSITLWRIGPPNYEREQIPLADSDAELLLRYLGGDSMDPAEQFSCWKLLQRTHPGRPAKTRERWRYCWRCEGFDVWMCVHYRSQKLQYHLWSLPGSARQIRTPGLSMSRTPSRLLRLHPLSGNSLATGATVLLAPRQDYRGLGGLGGLLLHLLERTGANVWPSLAFGDGLCAAVESACGDLEVANGVLLRGVTRIVRCKEDIADLDAQLLALPRTVDNNRVHGLLLALVVSHGQRSLSLRMAHGPQLQLEVESGGIHRPGMARTPGPYLVAITRAMDDAGSGVCLQAFLLPVLSPRCLLPVESHAERRCAQFLARMLRVGDKLEKPLRAISPQSDLRPDFVVSTGDSSKELAIEVLGFDDPVYLDSKRLQIIKYERLGYTYTKVEAYRAKSARGWSAVLRRLRAAVLLLHLAHP